MKTDAYQVLREFITIYNEQAQENSYDTSFQPIDEMPREVHKNLLETFRILLQRIEEWNHE